MDRSSVVLPVKEPEESLTFLVEIWTDQFVWAYQFAFLSYLKKAFWMKFHHIPQVYFNVSEVWPLHLVLVALVLSLDSELQMHVDPLDLA
jgi:hypothetical protein